MAEIANRLNSDKIPTRRGNGKGWMNNSVRDVLWNPAYKGKLVVNIHKGQRRKKGRFFHDIPKDAITIDVPAIVSKKTWDITQERRNNNKHMQPPKNGHWLLQGLITCGLCGYSLRVQPSRGKRHYTCRGRLKYAHVDGSPRCRLPRIDANWLENEVWFRIENIINDPNKLEVLVAETIENLRIREIDLAERIMPINNRLAEIAEQKAKLADDWVQANLDSTKFKELQSQLEKEESRLLAIRSEHDPAQIEELEYTRHMLNYWQGQLQALNWDTETEDGQKVRVVEKPHKAALRIIGVDNEKLSEVMFFPTTKRQILDKLQVRLVVFEDRVEINSVFPIQPIDCQSLQPAYRSAGFR